MRNSKSCQKRLSPPKMLEPLKERFSRPLLLHELSKPVKEKEEGERSDKLKISVQEVSGSHENG